MKARRQRAGLAERRKEYDSYFSTTRGYKRPGSQKKNGCSQFWLKEHKGR